MMKIIVKLMACMLLFTVMAPASGAEVLIHGEFAGKSGHATSGRVSIVERAGNTFVVLDENFRFTGAPDPKLGFGVDGRYDGRTQFSPLKSNHGKQEYQIPDSIDPSNYDEIYVWCEKFGVPLGVAALR